MRCTFVLNIMIREQEMKACSRIRRKHRQRMIVLLLPVLIPLWIIGWSLGLIGSGVSQRNVLSKRTIGSNKASDLDITVEIYQKCPV